MSLLVVGGPIGGESHVEPPGHPERRARLRAVMAGIEGFEMVTVGSRRADAAELLRVHSTAHLELVAGAGPGRLDPDTFVADDSYATALEAAGAGLAVVAHLEGAGERGVGFVVVRPPGHHATRNRPMGFCLFDNIAVVAASRVASGEKVAIVDWDVHHGNGTQEIFWTTPSVFFASTHQWPLYPGTGRPDEIGGGDARGGTLNVPLPPGATGDVWRDVWDRVLKPAIVDFGPDWVFVSAGFDGHRDDPLATLAFSAGDFATFAGRVVEVAPPGRLMFFLEGGYDLRALQASTRAVFGNVLGVPQDGAMAVAEEPTSGGPGLGVSEEVLSIRRGAGLRSPGGPG